MKQKAKEFIDENGLKLIVKHKKSAVILEADSNQINDKKFAFDFRFTPKQFKEFFQYMRTVANEAWGNVISKQANSVSSDYFEYYDTELDDNGYLDITQFGLKMIRPALTSNRLYKFTKRKWNLFCEI